MTTRTVNVVILVVALLAGCHQTTPHRRHAASATTSSTSPTPSSVAIPDDAPTGIQALALGLPLPAETPADPDDARLMTQPSYALSYNRSKGGPNWAAWRITAADYGGARRPARFQPDPALPGAWYHVRHDDYAGTGYDRGHMVDAADRNHDDHTIAETFLTTNILPQTHAMNAGPWLGLETACRTLAKHDGRWVYVVAGPIWGTKTIAGGKVNVPTAFWKVAVVLAPGQTAHDIDSATPVLAAVMPNVDGIEHAKWTTYRTSLRETQRFAGWQVLTAISAAQRRALEGDR